MNMKYNDKQQMYSQAKTCTVMLSALVYWLL